MSGCLLYALLSNYSKAAGWPPPGFPQPPPSAAIEIVDLDSLRRVKSFSIGARKPTSLELVNGRLYVVDPSHDEVVVLTGSGANVAKLRISPAASDCVAAPDGSRVYVASSEAIDVIDTTELRVERSVPVQPYTASGVAISDDGGTVVAVGERAGAGVAFVLNAEALSVREVHLAGAQAALDAAFFKRDGALVWTGSSFIEVNTSSATQIPAATVPTSGSGLGATFGISTLQFSSPAHRAFAVDYIEVNIFGVSVPLGVLESLDPRTGLAPSIAGFALPPYLIRLAPTGDKLCFVEGHEVSGFADALSVFDVHTGSLSFPYLFSERDLFVTDVRLHCPTGIPAWHWPAWPWPVPQRPVRGSGEGIWFFVDPLWDPVYGLAANVGLGLGGRLGRGIARMIDNWRRRFSTPNEPASPPRD
jgi:YVTN family beta-propeller protein